MRSREKIISCSAEELADMISSEDFQLKLRETKKGKIKFALDRDGLEDALIFLSLALIDSAEKESKKLLSLQDIVEGSDKRKARKIAICLSGFSLGKGWDVNTQPEEFHGFTISEFKEILDLEWSWLRTTLAEL